MRPMALGKFFDRWAKTHTAIDVPLTCAKPRPLRELTPRLDELGYVWETIGTGPTGIIRVPYRHGSGKNHGLPGFEIQLIVDFHSQGWWPIFTSEYTPNGSATIDPDWHSCDVCSFFLTQLYDADAPPAIHWDEVAFRTHCESNHHRSTQFCERGYSDPSADLLIVAVPRPALAPAALGWTPPATSRRTLSQITAILANWEERYGAAVTELFCGGMRIQHPPLENYDEDFIACEHAIFAGENTCDGYEEYREQVHYEGTWDFWWD